jgi:hypothetical protein
MQHLAEYEFFSASIMMDEYPFKVKSVLAAFQAI